MVLSGKAELAAKVEQTAKIRYERVELCGIGLVLVVASILSYMLYLSMVDGWQLHSRVRWRVFAFSMTLLILSVIACIYLCYRIHPTVRLNSSPPSTLASVNSQLYLIGGEQPPSYDAVSHSDSSVPPPPYNAVLSV